ncbi:MAG TPA: hypothetical protein PKD90_01080 [Phnomibacter sp.]|nr:hypothetical protein [Phnomibacter sp.]
MPIFTYMWYQKTALYGFVTFLCVSCTRKPDSVKVVLLHSYDTLIQVQAAKAAFQFTDSFFYLLQKRFPAVAEHLLYSLSQSHLTPNIQLTDTSFVYAILHTSNKLYLLNHLPPDLSVESHDHYFKRSGFYAYTDSANLARQDSLLQANTRWEPVSVALQQEFATFISLLRAKQDYLFLIPKAIIQQ